MFSRELDLLTRLEQKTLLLTRDYQLQKQEVRRLVDERNKLISENEMYVVELSKLREQLSLVAFALPHTPEAKDGLNDLKLEILEITSEVDACIALLRRGVK